MAYSSDIARRLTEQISKFVTLNRHQLAGQLANLDFWTAEVQHCLEVIDGYSRRFDQMKAAQMRFAAEHGTIEFDLDDPCFTRTPAAPPTRVPNQDLGDARRHLCDAFYRFLIRGLHDGVIDERALRHACATLDIGVESSDLRRQI